MKKTRKRASFDDLSSAEKEAIYQECETIRPEDGQPLTKEDMRQHRKAGLRVGRPRVGRGVKRINTSVEQGLLETADRFARRHGMTRARLIAQRIRAFISGAA